MSNTKKSIILLTALLTIACVSACADNADSSTAPDFTLLNLQGETVSLADFKGKAVLVNFFATYCPPCRAEIPDFVDLQKKYRAKGFVVIGISVDENGPFVLPPFIQALDINYPVLMATSKVIADYGNIYALPQSFMLDTRHRIVKHFMGMVTREDLEPLIKEALEKD